MKAGDEKRERRRVRVVRMAGLVPYGRAHAIQERLQEERVRGEIPDTLLLLQHAPVITLGRGAKNENVLLAKDALAARGIELHETGRGGDVTYHGPGQLVGYPILSLAPDRQDVRRYVKDLEETMLRTVAEHGLHAERISGMNGTWLRDAALGDRKIGAVGVRISRWVTMHGFALNVSTDLAHFALIVPCGIRDKSVTSLELELGLERGGIAIERVMDGIERHFAEIFDADLEPAGQDALAAVAGAEAHAPSTSSTG